MSAPNFAQLYDRDVSWIIRDGYIGNTFFDASASEFLLPTLAERYKSQFGVSGSNGTLDREAGVGEMVNEYNYFSYI